MSTKLDRSVPQEFYELVELAASNGLRLGQLFENARHVMMGDWDNPFYVENDKYVEYMRRLLLGEQNGHKEVG